MADEEANLDDEERAELASQVPEDEDPSEEIDNTPVGEVDKPTDMTDSVIEDEADFVEELVEDDDSLLNEPEGTRIPAGGEA